MRVQDFATIAAPADATAIEIGWPTGPRHDKQPFLCRLRFEGNHSQVLMLVHAADDTEGIVIPVPAVADPYDLDVVWDLNSGRYPRFILRAAQTAVTYTVLQGTE